MGGKDKNYQIIRQGKSLGRYVPGGWVLFQRVGDPIDRSGERTYWLGRTLDGVFALGPNFPVSYGDALQYIVHAEAVLFSQPAPPVDTHQMPLF